MMTEHCTACGQNFLKAEEQVCSYKYWGTLPRYCARPLPNVCPITKVGSGTQGRVRDNNPLDTNTPSSSRKSNKAQGQRLKDPTAMEINVPSAQRGEKSI